jgi:uncharacterized protein (DUF58 family)
MFRPAPRALWFGVWLTLASLAVAALQPQLWWVIAGGWLVLVLAMLLDALRALPGGRMRMDVSAPPVLYIGEDDPLVLRFSAQGRGQATFLRAAPDVTGPIEDLPTLSTGFDPSDTVAAALEYRIRPTARGTVQLPAVHLGWAGPWLLVERRRVIRTDWEVAVIPNVRAVQREAVQLRKLAEDFGAKVQRIVGSGSEFEALMEFQAGHETRHIDWKHSARHRKLLVKDMQVERNHQIILAHDTGYLMREPIEGVPKLDHAINAALKLAWLGLSTGDSIGLYAFADTPRSFVAPRGGKPAFNPLRLATQDIDYISRETNFTLGLSGLNQRIGRRSLIVLFTDFTDTITAALLMENVAALTRKHLVVFAVPKDPFADRILDQQPEGLVDATRAVVAETFANERRVVFDRLRRLGVEVLEVPPKGFSAALLNTYLSVKERSLL